MKYMYYGALLAALAGFALFDVKHQRVPNKALVIFIPFILLSWPILCFCTPVYTPPSPITVLLSQLLGMGVGFAILIGAALITHDGIGGGDIKLVALLGFVYGAYGIAFVLFVASGAALLYSVGYRLLCRKEQTLRLAFVPFLCLGSTILTLFML